MNPFYQPPTNQLQEHPSNSNSNRRISALALNHAIALEKLQSAGGETEALSSCGINNSIQMASLLPQQPPTSSAVHHPTSLLQHQQQQQRLDSISVAAASTIRQQQQVQASFLNAAPPTQTKITWSDQPQLNQKQPKDEPFTSTASLKKQPEPIPAYSKDSSATLHIKIQKAARKELEYLNKAKHAQDKHKEWTALYQKLKCKQNKDEKSQKLETKLKPKIIKAKKMERAFQQQAKELRDQRYRWTKLYQISQQDSNEATPEDLPPLPQLIKRKKSESAEEQEDGIVVQV